MVAIPTIGISPMHGQLPRNAGKRAYTKLMLTTYLLKQFHLVSAGQPAPLPLLHPRSLLSYSPPGPKLTSEGEPDQDTEINLLCLLWKREHKIY
jgi:hypothetical protein